VGGLVVIICGFAALALGACIVPLQQRSPFLKGL